MNLESNEYTTKTFLDYLIETFGVKINGKEFTTNDVAQYLIRGYTPHRYGNIQISSSEQTGVRIITVKKKEVPKNKAKK